MTAVYGATSVRPILSVNNVSKVYGRRASLLNNTDFRVVALDSVSFSVAAGQSFGVVGESGSGKSTLARLLTRLESPTQGTVEFDGVDLASLSGRELLDFRRRVQIVFQNPYSSVNPRRSIRQTLSAGYEIHHIGTRQDREERLRELIGRVGLQPHHLDRYPHQLSGGQLQRVAIARALSVDPQVIVADEPVSALDVSVQAKVLNLLKSLQREFDLAVILITHDLRVVNFFCDRVGVFYRGHLVELGQKPAVIRTPLHPYTAALLESAPSAGSVDSRKSLEGETADSDTAYACPFVDRCWLRPRSSDPERCVTVRPPLTEHDAGRLAACHFAGTLGPATQLHEAASTAPPRQMANG